GAPGPHGRGTPGDRARLFFGPEPHGGRHARGRAAGHREDADPQRHREAAAGHGIGSGKRMSEDDDIKVPESLARAFAAWPTDVLRPPPSLQDRLARRIGAESGKPMAPPAPSYVEPEWYE